MPPYDMVANAGEIFDPAASDHNDRVLLQVMADPRDVSRYLHPISQPHPSDLPQSGVRLFGSGRSYLNTDPPLERGTFWQFDRPHLQSIKPPLQGRRLAFLGRYCPLLPK